MQITISNLTKRELRRHQAENAVYFWIVISGLNSILGNTYIAIASTVLALIWLLLPRIADYIDQKKGLGREVSIEELPIELKQQINEVTLALNRYVKEHENYDNDN